MTCATRQIASAACGGAPRGPPVLDPALVELARRRIVAEIETRERAFGGERAKLRARFAGYGTPSSSRQFVAMLELCADEADRRAQMAWQALREVVETAQVSPTDVLAGDLKAAFDEITPLYGLRGHIKADRFPDLQKQHLVQLDRAIDAARAKVHAHVDLFVLRLRQRPAAETAAAITFNAPVGIVQTGANAVAVLHLGDRERGAIARALEQLRGDVRALGRVEGADLGEIIDLTDEVQAELEKPQPNRLRVGAVLGGIATAIQTTASLRPAYDVLKAAAALVGVALP